MITNHFTVIGYYRNVPGIYEAQAEIQADVIRIYQQVWGNKIQRTRVFAFAENTKVITVQVNLYECK